TIEEIERQREALSTQLEPLLAQLHLAEQTLTFLREMLASGAVNGNGAPNNPSPKAKRVRHHRRPTHAAAKAQAPTKGMSMASLLLNVIQYGGRFLHRSEIEVALVNTRIPFKTEHVGA